MLDPGNPVGAIVLGLLTAAILAILALIWRGASLRIRDFLYFRQGRVEGTWKASKDNAYAHFSFAMEISQLADRLTGTLRITRDAKSAGGPGDYVRDFTLEGRKLESFIALTCTSSDPKVLAIIGGVFGVERQGLGLDGKWTYRDTTSNAVLAEDLNWTKQ